MFTELAVIDWIALVFAAVLLSAAIAAAVLAYITSSHGQLPALSTLRHRASRADSGADDLAPAPNHARSVNGRDSSRTAVLTPPPIPEHAAGSPLHARASLPEEPAAGDGSPTDGHEESVDESSMTDVDRRLAERAARLRGRPMPEKAPLVHKKLVQQVVANRAPLHAEEPRTQSVRSGVSGESANFERTEGFKARTPGFFDDPLGRHELRYWDGHTWTEYVKEHGERFTDPL